jgi:MFS family permease
LATYGVGILIGSLVFGPIGDYFATADTHQWRQICIIPAIIAAVVLVLFLLLYKDRSTAVTANLGLESELTTLEAPGTALPMPRDRNVDR